MYVEYFEICSVKLHNESDFFLYITAENQRFVLTLYKNKSKIDVREAEIRFLKIIDWRKSYEKNSPKDHSSNSLRVHGSIPCRMRNECCTFRHIV